MAYRREEGIENQLIAVSRKFIGKRKREDE